MKSLYLSLVVFCLSIGFAIAQTPPQPVFFNFENPSVNQLAFNNARISTTTPIFRVGTPSGAVNPNLIYIEINTDPGFAGVSYSQTFSGSFVNGTPNDFTFNNGFTPLSGTTYYVRAKASGDGGATYSSFSTGTYSFNYIKSGTTDWYQSTRAQFLTDALSGDSATNNGVVLSAVGGGGPNPFTNPSFENGLTGWSFAALSQYLGDETSNWVTTSTSALGVSAGSNCLDIFIGDGFSGNWYGGDYSVAGEEINLTGINTLTFTKGYYDEPLDQFDDIEAGSVNLEVIIDPTNSTDPLAGTVVYTWSQPVNGSASSPHTPVSIDLSSFGFTGTNFVKFVNVIPGNGIFIWGDFAHMYIDNINVSASPSGLITSTGVDLGSIKGGSKWATLKWNQTQNSGALAFKMQKAISGTWTDVAGLNAITSATDGDNSVDISSIPVTTPYDSVRIVAAMAMPSGGISPSLNNWAIDITGCTAPVTPTVTVTNNCGNSVLSTTATGALAWSTGATTSSITVTNTATYSVTTTVNTCTSAPGTGNSAPKAIPSAPTVISNNSCGSSTLSTTAAGTLLWSNGSTTSSITVTNIATYSVTTTVNGCISAAGVGISVPSTVPSTPVVSVTNNCGSSVLSTTAAGALVWSTAATTSSITVTNAATYSVTTTVTGCTSAAGTGASNPNAVPSAPIVSVTNNCGNSVLSTTATGVLAWSNGATTSSITVTNAATYSVTATANGCTGPSGTGVSAPFSTPSAPTVLVSNNCGSSVLSTFSTGSLLWSTGATTSSITVTNAATYSVTVTVSGCASATGTGTSAPQIAPGIGATNNCGNSVLTIIAASGSTYLWSANGATTSSITVTASGMYNATIFGNGGGGCTTQLSITAAPLVVPSSPVVSVVNSCGSSVLSTTSSGSLSWSTGATSSSITVTNAATYTVTVTAGGCTSAGGTGTSAPSGTPATPVVLVTNNCGSSVLSTAAAGSLVWSTGATTSSITVTDATTYSVTATISGCASTTGTGTSAPLTVPPPPKVSVTNNCGNTVLSATTPFTLLWSTGATTSSITVTDAATYSVSTVLSGCTSAPSTGVSAPKTIPSAPVVIVVNACGISTLSTNAPGSLLWTPGGSNSSSIVVAVEGTYSVTTTINGCTSPAGTGVASPSSGPSAPTVNVSNNCGNSVLSTTAGGSLLWSNGATTSSITVTDAATYSVTTTVSSCTSTPGTGTSAPIAIPSAPDVTVVNACGSSTLSTTAAGLLVWSNGSVGTSSITVTTAGTYSVTVTVNECVSPVGTGVASPSSGPSAPTVNVTDNCGNSVLFTASAGSLLWSNGATTSSITVTDAATYSVTTTVNNCTSPAGTGVAAPITVPPSPKVSVTNNCGNSVLSATSPFTLLWSTGATTSSITVTDAATYSVNTVLSGCTSAPSTGTSAPKAIPSQPVVNVSNNCGTSTLNTTSAGSLLWNNGATTSSITVTDAATYSVTATVNGCTSTAGTGTSAPKAIPATPVVSVANNCGSSTLSTTAPGLLVWSTGDVATSSITVTTAGTYSVTTTVDECTSAVGTGTASPSSQGTATINEVDNCGNSVLSTTSTGNLLWSTGASTSSITVTASGSYSLAITTIGSNCNATASVNVTVKQNPVVTITANKSDTICLGDSLILTASGAETYVWHPFEQTTPSIIAITAQTYFVTGTGSNGCSSNSSNSITVAVNANPTVTVTGTNGTCRTGGFASTCANPLPIPGDGTSYTYLWNTLGTDMCISGLSAGTYSVTITDENGCKANASGTVSVNTTPPAANAGGDKTIGCGGSDTLQLIGSSNDPENSFLWTASGGGNIVSGANTATVTVDAAGIYTLTVTNPLNGCTATSVANVTFSQTIDCTISGNGSLSCNGNGNSNHCNLGCGSKGNPGCGNQCNPGCGNQFNPGCGGNNGNCYSGYGSCYHDYDNHQHGGNNDSGNVAGSTQLCAPSGYASYLWSTGATTACITVTATGTYSVTVSNGAGCSSTCSKTVTGAVPPSCDITGNSTICDGQSTNLCAPAGDGLTYQWSTGDTTQCITINAGGTYFVTVTNSGGCSSTCSQSVRRCSAPNCTIYAGCGQNISCSESSTTFCASEGIDGNATFLWSTGETTRCINIRETGTYSLTVTNGFGCSSTCSRSITIGSTPACYITGNANLCKGEYTTLCGPDSSGLSYRWSTGSKSQCINVKRSGTYYLTVTNAGGCSSTCDVYVAGGSHSNSCFINGILTFKKGGSTTLCAPNGFESYQWNTGDTTQCITVKSAGCYTVTVTTSGGCSETGQACVVCNNNNNNGCGNAWGRTMTSSDNNEPMNSYGNIDAAAYPNPFSDLTTITFRRTDEAAHVSVEVYAIDGNKVATLFDGNVEAGVVYKAEFDASTLTEGMYIYRIISDDNIINGKLMLFRH